MNGQAVGTGENRPEAGPGTCTELGAGARLGADDLTSRCDRLYTLARNMEAFLGEQLDRLEAALQYCQVATEAGATARRDLAALENQRSAWERQRAEEMTLLEHERCLLVEAWEGVEEEQRKLLAQRGPTPPPGAAPGPPRDVLCRAEVGDAPRRSAELAAIALSAHQLSEPGAVEGDLDPDVTVQFEKVKCDVRKHSLTRRGQ